MIPPNPLRTTPDRVLVAGDWHGNLPWARGIVELAASLLPTESAPLILHAGDFGIWPGPGGRRYLKDLSAVCEDNNVTIAFVDGNHEDHPRLTDLAAAAPGGARPAPLPVVPRIWHLPRGTRWSWHGRRWLGLGGAVSVDRCWRTEGVNWWPAEAITLGQLVAVRLDGPAEVVLAHDCPAGVPLKLPPPPASWAAADLARAAAHREILLDLALFLAPRYWIHGHYHLFHRTPVLLDGDARLPCEVTGLDCDDTLAGNYAVLDVRTMEWN